MQLLSRRADTRVIFIQITNQPEPIGSSVLSDGIRHCRLECIHFTTLPPIKAKSAPYSSSVPSSSVNIKEKSADFENSNLSSRKTFLSSENALPNDWRCVCVTSPEISC
jgi:hypothetical protein